MLCRGTKTLHSSSAACTCICTAQKCLCVNGNSRPSLAQCNLSFPLIFCGWVLSILTHHNTKSKGWIKAFLYDKKFVVILREDTFIYCKKSNPNIEIPIGFLKDIG